MHAPQLSGTAATYKAMLPWRPEADAFDATSVWAKRLHVLAVELLRHVGMLVAAPLIGLAGIVLLPLVGPALLLWALL